jgi:hypothetical protein
MTKTVCGELMDKFFQLFGADDDRCLILPLKQAYVTTRAKGRLFILDMLCGYPVTARESR